MEIIPANTRKPGRPRLHDNDAEKYRAYRQRKKARNFVADSPEFRQGKRLTKRATKPGRPRLHKTPAARQKAYEKRQKVKVYHRSQRDNWETPPDIFTPLHAEFGFTLDACAEAHTAKCPRYYTIADDALKQPWEGVCWMNPPYGGKVERWLKKAYESSLAGATVVCLVKSSTDTRWWHELVQPYAEVRYLKGRPKFVGAPSGAPFAASVVIFRPPRNLP